MAPRSRQTVHLDLIVPDAHEVATEVVCDVPIVAERSIYWDPNGETLQPYEMRGGHSSPGTNSLDKEWFLAEGSTGEGFETFIQVINPQREAAKIKATFLNEEGAAAEKEMEMPARSRATLRISDYVPDDFHVSTSADVRQARRGRAQPVLGQACYRQRRRHEGRPRQHRRHLFRNAVDGAGGLDRRRLRLLGAHREPDRR